MTAPRTRRNPDRPTAPVRIGLVDDIDDPDLAEAGSRQILVSLARGLVAGGFDVVAFLRGEGRFPGKLRDEGVEVVPLDVPRGRPLYLRMGGRALPSPGGFATTAIAAPLAVRAFADRFRTNRLDAVYVAHPLSHILAGFGARLAGIPAVCHLQGIAQSGQRVKLMRPLYRVLCEASGCTVIAISQAVSDAYGGPAARRPRVIPNGVDVRRFRPRPPDPGRFAALGAPLNGRPVVGMVGTLEPIKRMHLLPELARQILDRRPDARIVVAGADLHDPTARAPGSPGSRPSPYVRRILDELQAQGIADRVFLAGRRDDIPDLLAGFDVLVHLCDQEGFGLVLAEAGSCEVPVVAVRAAGAAEVVEDGVTGLLVADPDDLEGLARQTGRLLADEAGRRAMGTRARERVVQRFSEDAFAAAFCTLFRELAANGRSPRHAG